MSGEWKTASRLVYKHYVVNDEALCDATLSPGHMVAWNTWNQSAPECPKCRERLNKGEKVTDVRENAAVKALQAKLGNLQREVAAHRVGLESNERELAKVQERVDDYRDTVSRYDKSIEEVVAALRLLGAR